MTCIKSSIAASFAVCFTISFTSVIDVSKRLVAQDVCGVERWFIWQSMMMHISLEGETDPAVGPSLFYMFQNSSGIPL